MKNNRLNTWEMSLEQFISLTRSIRYPQTKQRTGQFNSLMRIGCDYYIYVDIKTLDVVNPFTKKDKGKKYKSFFSSISADHAKELAYIFIQETINDF